MCPPGLKTSDTGAISVEQCAGNETILRVVFFFFIIIFVFVFVFVFFVFSSQVIIKSESICYHNNATAVFTSEFAKPIIHRLRSPVWTYFERQAKFSLGFTEPRVVVLLV